MLKYVLAGTTALAIAGASLAYAQQPGPGPRSGWKPTAEDVTAFGDARIAGLKAGLKLTPEQEKNWPAVEAALREMNKLRADRFAARANAQQTPQTTTDPVTRLGERADTMTQHGTAMKKLADAAKPLYQSLDESQKQRFAMLSRLGGGRDGMHRRGDRGGDRFADRGGRRHHGHHGGPGDRGDRGDRGGRGDRGMMR